MPRAEPEEESDDWLEAALKRAKDKEVSPPREPNGQALAISRDAAEALWARILAYLRRAQSNGS